MHQVLDGMHDHWTIWIVRNAHEPFHPKEIGAGGARKKHQKGVERHARTGPSWMSEIARMSSAWDEDAAGPNVRVLRSQHSIEREPTTYIVHLA